MRIATLVCAFALALAASEPTLLIGASAQIVPAGMGGGAPSGGASVGEMKPSEPAVAPERDPAERSAKSIECAQKADAQGLQRQESQALPAQVQERRRMSGALFAVTLV
jgi:hypothetical protein